jgi:hypothetical protein
MKLCIRRERDPFGYRYAVVCSADEENIEVYSSIDKAKAEVFLEGYNLAIDEYDIQRNSYREW